MTQPKGKLDDDEMRRIVERHGNAVYRLAFSRLRNVADAEDVSQNVFVRLYTSGKSFEDDEHLRAWLLRVTINCCNDFHRSFWQKFVCKGEKAEQTTKHMLADRSLTRYEENEINSELHQRMNDALQALGHKQRTAIHLFYYEDLSTEEISEITGEKPSTVRSHLRRARKILKRQLGDML